MIEWMWICWNIFLNVFIEQSGTVLTFLYSQTLSLMQVHSVHLFPSTIRQWNNLDLFIRNVGSMPHFKSELKKMSNSYSVNIQKYYSYGPRKLNIVLTQFRCTMIEWMWICWNIFLNVFIEQSGTVLTFLYSQTLSWGFFCNFYIKPW
jgi:hypothetical protein